MPIVYIFIALYIAKCLKHDGHSGYACWMNTKPNEKKLFLTHIVFIIIDGLSAIKPSLLNTYYL